MRYINKHVGEVWETYMKPGIHCLLRASSENDNTHGVLSMVFDMPKDTARFKAEQS
jgi:hypothetical protein